MFENNIKIDVRIGFIRFVIPHQRAIRKMINDSKDKTNKKLSKDLKNYSDNSEIKIIKNVKSN